MNTTHACHRILVAILLFSADFNEEGITALAQRVKKVLPASPPVSLIPLPRAEIENDEFSSDVDGLLESVENYSCQVEAVVVKSRNTKRGKATRPGVASTNRPQAIARVFNSPLNNELQHGRKNWL